MHRTRIGKRLTQLHHDSLSLMQNKSKEKLNRIDIAEKRGLLSKSIVNLTTEWWTLFEKGERVIRNRFIYLKKIYIFFQGIRVSQCGISDIS